MSARNDSFSLTLKGRRFAHDSSVAPTDNDRLSIIDFLYRMGEGSLEEIDGTVKLQHGSAKDIVDLLLKEGVIYIIPFRIKQTVTQSTKTNLVKSINEEAQAATAYRTRKITADPTTAKLYEHIAGEEDGHREEFNKRLTELESDKAKIKYNVLGGLIT